MRTKNFRNLCAQLSYENIFRKNDNDKKATIVDIDGESHQITLDRVSNVTLIGGGGSTQPTETDYKLENPIALTLVDKTMLYDTEHTLTLVQVWKNASTEPVTITEVACKVYGGDQYGQGGISYGWTGDFIISRDLITPITIPVGETRTIQYTIEF